LDKIVACDTFAAKKTIFFPALAVNFSERCLNFEKDASNR